MAASREREAESGRGAPMEAANPCLLRGATDATSEVEGAEKMTSNQLALASSLLPGMVALMLPALWPEAPQSRTGEQRWLAVSVPKLNLPEFLDKWNGMTIDQMMDMCTDVFHRAVDNAVVQHTVGEEEEESLQSELCVVCQSEYECGDCTETLSVCGHAFHGDCLRPWLKHSSHCPICREHCGVTFSAKRATPGFSAAQPPAHVRAADMTLLGQSGSEPVRGAGEQRPMSRDPFRPDGYNAREEPEHGRDVGLDLEDASHHVRYSETDEHSARSRMNFCPFCGCDGVHANFQFCPYCGESLADL
eukprot:TRINITY_DN8019_c0_g1_i1.p1 TRINITY_DN8019_c0_g1~~TRINITY_DN8019_c0_g1_i1.p1  ORF type:complete len:305 (-),score=30.87 TRINITY_DN8019_c0_g1_i1:363-1277(-)